jgi:hypothetical protein
MTNKKNLAELFSALNETNRNYVLAIARALAFAQDNTDKKEKADSTVETAFLQKRAE